MAVQETQVGNWKIKYWWAQEGEVFRVDAETSDATQTYNANWYFPQEPTLEMLTPYFKQWVAGIEREKAFEDNPLNQNFSNELGEEIRRIIHEAVKYVRSYKDVDFQGFKEWYDKRFPTSVFHVDALSKWLLRRLNKKSFDEVKEHFISAKFEEID